MRVLFLDVDGVLTVADGSGAFDPQKLDRLKQLALATDCQIVISSNWRLFPELEARLVTVLKERGMRVIGCTPDHGERSQPGLAVRPEEIGAWIESWKRTGAWWGEPIEAWCAVDDRPLLSESGGARLKGHFVQVDQRYGLTEQAVDRLAGILLGVPSLEDTAEGTGASPCVDELLLHDGGTRTSDATAGVATGVDALSLAGSEQRRAPAHELQAPVEPKVVQPVQTEGVLQPLLASRPSAPLASTAHDGLSVSPAKASAEPMDEESEAEAESDDRVDAEFVAGLAIQAAQTPIAFTRAFDATLDTATGCYSEMDRDGPPC